MVEVGLLRESPGEGAAERIHVESFTAAEWRKAFGRNPKAQNRANRKASRRKLQMRRKEIIAIASPLVISEACANLNTFVLGLTFRNHTDEKSHFCGRLLCFGYSVQLGIGGFDSSAP